MKTAVGTRGRGAEALVVLTTLLGTAGCRASAEEALVARGREVYKAQLCGSCHTLTSAGTTGFFGPSHDGIGKRAEERIRDPSYQGAAKTAEEYIRESILDPGAYRAPGFAVTRFVMPSYSQLPAEDIGALVEMLLHERGDGGNG
jgi:mono/diheme cytochrome c family protein